MNHKLYEEWLFTSLEPAEADALSAEQAASLQAHLQECQGCQQLADAWQAVETRLSKPVMFAPPPGFTSRWQARLEADRRQLERRQSLAMLAFGSLAVMLVLGSLLILLWPWLRSPNVLVWAGLYRAFTLYSIADAIQEFLEPFMRTAADIVPLTWWVFFAGILTELGVLWVVSYRMLTNPRRIA
ncbi:MAG: hypothetical protein AB1894_08505 [Chloroflexota bacterium]